MNPLKSIFISSYMTLAMAIAGYAGWMLYQGGNPIAWSGVMLTAGPLLTVIPTIAGIESQIKVCKAEVILIP